MIKLTKDEKAILRSMDKKYKWIARDKDGELSIYIEKPIKSATWWVYHVARLLHVYNHLFTFIKWEDEEPYLIEDLLREEKTEEYDDYDEEEDGIPFDDEKWEE